MYGPHLPATPLPVIEKRQQRTITEEAQPITPYISGERLGPQSLVTVDATEEEKSQVTAANKKNFLWLYHEMLTVTHKQFEDRLHVMMRWC